MKILIACEESQIVCKAFRAKGHEAYSCDIQDYSGGRPEWHIKCDVLRVLEGALGYNELIPWDLIIAHPSCQFITNSGVRWLYNPNGTRNIDRWVKLEEAMIFFNQFKGAAKKVCIENPIPHKYAKNGFEWLGHTCRDKHLKEHITEGIGAYTQIIQPWQFGHGETKATCLWLEGLPKLQHTNIVSGREQRIWKMAPGPERTKERSKTYQGIANAMAEQWG